MFDKNSILDILSYSVKKTGESITGIFSLVTGVVEYMYRDNTDSRLENGLLQLKNARDAVNLREAQLRESVKEYSTRAMLFKKKKLIREAKVMVKLYMLYDLQVKHCQDTISAIESHIISLETAAINKQVCSALKDSSLVGGMDIIDEDILDNAVDRLSDRNESTGEFIRTLGTTPGMVDLSEDDIVGQSHMCPFPAGKNIFKIEEVIASFEKTSNPNDFRPLDKVEQQNAMGEQCPSC